MKQPKIAIIGTRGIPANYGGFETFAEEVCVRLVEMGIETIVIGDKSLNYNESHYKGIEIFKSNISKPGNPLKFYKQSIQIAQNNGAAVIIMCGVGGSLLIPFYSKKNSIIAVNPDGLGFKRDKYVWWKKFIFFTQYLVASWLSPHLVCDSIGIAEYYQKSFKRKKNLTIIEYGTYLNTFSQKEVTKADLESYGLNYEPNKYHLVVSRLEPENNVQMIIEGYLKSEKKYPLVIVGNTNTKHSQELIKYKNENIHFVGGIYEREKLMIFRAASLTYFHGHSVGGTNPSLLEAMGSKNFCICHDNIFNREVVQENGKYFQNSDEANETFIFAEEEKNNSVINAFKDGVYLRAINYYSWENIAKKYLVFSQKVMNN